MSIPKIHNIIIAGIIFVMCWLVFGFRGVDAGVIGVLTYLGGVSVGRKESDVEEFFTKLKKKYVD